MGLAGWKQKRKGPTRWGGARKTAPRSALGFVPGDEKAGAGRVGESTAVWYRLRTLCYQHPDLRRAFDTPTAGASCHEGDPCAGASAQVFYFLFF